MRRRLVRLAFGLLLAALAAGAALPCAAAVNPFTGEGAPEKGERRTVEEPQPQAPPNVAEEAARPGPWSALLAELARIQRELRDGLSARVRALLGGATPGTLTAFLALALGYGALHAAGPGHGKAVAVAYVLARGETAPRAALLGLLMGAAHAASATGLVLILYVVLSRSLLVGFTSHGLWLERASYALVCAIALWMLARAARGGTGEGGPACENRKGLVATGLCTGLVPCPGAAIVLLFSLALGAVWIGLAAVAAMALGMGLTIACAAALAAVLRRGAMGLAAARPGWAAWADRALSVAGALAVLALGATLLLASFQG